MNIGVFGDSYADRVYNPKKLKTWIKYLQDETNFQVTSYAKSGSSFYFSIQEFFRYKDNFDKIIFLVTFPGRIFLHNNPEFPHMCSVGNCDLRLQEQLSIQERNIISGVREYLLHVQNFAEEIFKQHCMYEYLKNNYPHVLFLPVDQNSIPNWDQNTLTDISHIDYTYYNVDFDAPKKDLRCCHMNDANNKIFAEKIAQWINDGTFSLKVEDFQPPTESKEEIWDDRIYL